MEPAEGQKMAELYNSRLARARRASDAAGCKSTDMEPKFSDKPTEARPKQHVLPPQLLQCIQKCMPVPVFYHPVVA